MTTIQLLVFIFIGFFALIFMGVAFYGFGLFNSQIEAIPDFIIGNISFQDNYENTLGAGMDAVMNTFIWSTLLLLFGMVIVMLIVGYTFQTNQKLFIILDIFIIIGAFVVSVYLSQFFETFINSNPEFLDIFSNEFYLSSLFILLLPYAMPVIGILIMFASYIMVRKREPNILGYES